MDKVIIEFVKIVDEFEFKGRVHTIEIGLNLFRIHGWRYDEPNYALPLFLLLIVDEVRHEIVYLRHNILRLFYIL